MSWGAYNICSGSHAIHHNVEIAAGAKIGIRYPFEFDSRGLRFWASPAGAIYDSGRLARSYEKLTWLYAKNESPSPQITFYHGNPAAGGDAWKIQTLNGYDCSPTGAYYATFQNQCDRMWVGQNAVHYYNPAIGYDLDIGTGTWLQPAKVTISNVMADPSYYEQRPYMAPTMPHNDFAGADTFKALETKRGFRQWVRDGWAYKKATAKLNDHGPHEFDWEEWESADFYNATPTMPDKNLLYLVEKRYDHGPNCNGTHTGYPNPRQCNDRKLVGIQPHYWCKTAPAASPFTAEALLKSWCVEDEYPYGGGGARRGWPPYSNTWGATSFQRTRKLEFNKSHQTEPYYAKTDKYSTEETSLLAVDGYAALCERIPAHTAFDLIIYLQVVNYVICEKSLSGTWPNRYHAKVDSGYFNTNCYCLFHQIAPVPPKP